jgi:hypothetical protein
MNMGAETQRAMRLMKLEEQKKREDRMRQKAFDRGYRAGYAAGVLSVQPEGEEES